MKRDSAIPMTPTQQSQLWRPRSRRFSRGRFRNGRGFTLIELIATIVVLGILGSVSAGIIFTASDGYLQASTTATLHKDASLAMDRMMRELRAVERDESVSEFAPRITQITPNSVRWHDDSRFYLQAGALMFVDDGAPAVSLADDVIAFTVRAYDADGNAMTPALNGNAYHPIRRIELTLSLSRHGATETLRSRVFIRSMMGEAGGGA